MSSREFVRSALSRALLSRADELAVAPGLGETKGVRGMGVGECGRQECLHTLSVLSGLAYFGVGGESALKPVRECCDTYWGGL